MRRDISTRQSMRRCSDSSPRPQGKLGRFRCAVLRRPRSSLLVVWAVCLVIGLACGTAAILHMHRGRANTSTISATNESAGASPIVGSAASVSVSNETGGATGGGNAQPEVRLVKYTVKPGDTLSSIAEAYNTSVESIAYINGLLSPDRISVGKELSVIANASGIVVEVSRGDTISEISARYNVPVDVIVKVNHLDDPDSISAGQSLILPGARPAGRPVQAVSRYSALRWPLVGSVTSGFGWRIHPITGASEFHQGIDIAASEGTPVVAAAAGTVTFAGWYGDYGRLIAIDHGNGIETRYAHLSGYAVSQGSEVSAGEVIGYVGSSGLSTGPHLHFEVRTGGKAVDPRDYLP